MLRGSPYQGSTGPNPLFIKDIQIARRFLMASKSFFHLSSFSAEC
jgi:hypothetical protein